MKVRTLWFAFIISCFFSCEGIEKKHLVGRYYLVTVDYLNENTSLSYELEDENFIGVVPGSVYAVAFCEKQIFVKQHPKEYEGKIDSSITSYYIIPIYKEYTLYPDKGVLGPFNEEQFESMCSRLNLCNPVTFKEYRLIN